MRVYLLYRTVKMHDRSAARDGCVVAGCILLSRHAKRYLGVTLGHVVENLGRLAARALRAYSQSQDDIGTQISSAVEFDIGIWACYFAKCENADTCSIASCRSRTVFFPEMYAIHRNIA